MEKKNKAIELYNKFRNELPVTSANYRAKKLALIAVNEILKLPFEYQSERNYWQEVKKEINKL